MTVKKLSTFPSAYLVSLGKKTYDIYISVNFKFGYNFETDRQFGIGHILEHYITGQDEPNKGFEIDGDIGDDDINFYLKTNKKNFDKDLKKFLAAIFNPSFKDNALLASEKKAITNELAVKYHDIYSHIWDAVVSKRFNGKNKYSRSRKNQIGNIGRFNSSDLKKHHKRLIANGNPFILVGVYNPDKKTANSIVSLVNALAIKKTAVQNKIIKPVFSKYKRKTEILRGITPKHSVLRITFPGLSMAQSFKERSTLLIALQLIKQQTLEKIRTFGVYDLDYFSRSNFGFGIIGFRAELPNKLVNEVLDSLLFGINNFKAGNINTGLLKKIIKDQKNDFTESWESNREMYDWALEDILYYGKLLKLSDIKKDLRSIAKTDVQHSAKKFLNNKQINILIFK